MLQLFQSYLGGETKPRVGAQHTLNAEYFKRIDALNYTMLHDDGQHTDDLEQADVVLVGVSRTSKTPTSIYLANRGVKTANVPLVPGVPVPPNLETLTQPLVVGLTASPERIVQIRQNRLLGLRAEHDADQYVDRQAVAEEIAFSRKLCGRHNWPIIDVTRRSIEETAAAVMALLAERRRQRGGLTMPLWLRRPSRWCSPRKARCAARCWRRPASRSRSPPPRSTSARIEARAGLADPGEVAALLAREKARAVAAAKPGRIVLGADQTLALGERRFSKAADRAGAREQLARAARQDPHAAFGGGGGARRRRCCSSMSRRRG